MTIANDSPSLSLQANQLLKSAAGRRLLQGMGGRDRGMEIMSHKAELIASVA